MNYAAAAEETLSRHINNERNRAFVNYSTAPLTRVLGLLGHPEQRVPVLHVAGTNGKGSTAGMLHELLSRHGTKPGLYTSPHLIRVNERISLTGPISDDALCRTLELIESTHAAVDLTYFDMLTAAAYLHFADSGCSHAVIECGLGGRLDSTNVMTPLVSVITTIGLDHTHVLGSTIEEIAAEKAGIIKPGIPLVTEAASPGLTVLLDAARNLNAPAYVLGRDFHPYNVRVHDDSCTFDFTGGDVAITGIRIKYPIAFQASNFATALMTLIASGILPDPEAVRTAAREFHIPGRFETGRTDPIIMFDPAHNPESIFSLAKTLRARYPEKSIRLFFTVMADKDYAGIREIIDTELDPEPVYVNIPDQRAFTHHEGIPEQDIPRLISLLDPSGVNIFTGSFRLYSVFKAVCAGFE